MSTTADTNQAMLTWIGRIGAAGAEEVAARLGISAAGARARLAACERSGLAEGVRLLQNRPPLYVATRAGLRAAGLADLKPCRVSPGSFAHFREVARAAVALESAHPQAAVIGERELRLWERDTGRPLASAELGFALEGGYARHRPDLVLWPADRAGVGGSPALAVEVELTVKAAPRLRAIVRGWARSRLVTGVVYYASPEAARAVSRAVADEQAQEMVHLVELDRVGELPDRIDWPAGSTSPVPSPA